MKIQIYILLKPRYIDKHKRIQTNIRTIKFGSLTKINFLSIVVSRQRKTKTYLSIDT